MPKLTWKHSGIRICEGCSWPASQRSAVHKPIEYTVSPFEVEARQHHVMDLQYDLLWAGTLPAYDDDEIHGEELGVYHTDRHRPVDEEWYEGQWAFTSHPFAPGRKYRGTLEVPACWLLRQSRITEYFTPLRLLTRGLQHMFDE